MPKRVRYLFWICLYAAFVVFAVVLADYVGTRQLVEVWGWDYRTFIGQINDWQWIGYFGFRHPGLGLVCSPLVALQHLWSGAYLFIMPAVATVTAWLIWRMAGWIGLGVWLLFPTTWLMAGIPESFPLAQLALVGSVYISRVEVKRGRMMWFAGVVALNGAITLTNGLKPLLAYVVTCGDWKKRAKIVGGAFVLVVVGAGLFAVRSWVTGRGVGVGLEATFSWIPETRNFPQEFYGFFIRPVGFIQSVFVYPAAFYGLYRVICVRDICLLLTFVSYLAVDILIHWIIGWGMSEPWVFTPHWIWMVPLIVGHGIGRTTENVQ